MTNENLGSLLAIDMDNGYTYIGREQCHNNPLMLKEAMLIRTNLLEENYQKKAEEEYIKENNKEKEIRIDKPGPIHFLK